MKKIKETKWCYEFITFHFRWLSKFQVRPGFLHDSIAILEKMKDNTDEPLYQHSAIVFDDVYIDPTKVEMDQKTQTIYGPNRSALLVLIRGLASH